MDNDEMIILRELQKENVWWQTGEVPKNLAKDFKRSDYYAYKKFFDNDKVNVIIGPRRVGKSTVLYQLVSHLIKNKRVNPKNIIFLSLDRAFFEITKNPIEKSLKVYGESVLKEPITKLNNTIYLFIDEASRNPNWAKILKQYIDLKYNIKFFVSGSSSPALYGHSVESLVGRKNDAIMMPLKFRDVLRIRNIKIETDDFQVIAGKLRKAFIDAITLKKPELFFEAVNNIYVSISPESETLMQILLNEYLLKGGYPEFYDKKINWVDSSRLMSNAYFEAIISYDIIKVFGSKTPANIRILYIMLALCTSDISNMTEITERIGASRSAIDNYFHQLQSTYLINTSSIYRKNKRNIKNEKKKVYVCDVGMRNAVLGLTETEFEDTNLQGKLAETVAQNHLRRLKYCIEPNKPNEVFFWKYEKNKKEKEVDFMVEFKNEVIPMESKFRNKIRPEDIVSIKNAIKEFKSPFGILLTKNSLHMTDNLISIPLWLFLLIC